MTLAELELFVGLFRQKTLSEVAARMGMSQPRASQLLQRLERELNCTLFQRSPLGLEPTSAGYAFRPFAKKILLLREEGITAAVQACEGISGALHVGVSHTASAFTVPFIMREFHNVYPNVHLKLTKALPPQLLAGMESGVLDLCLCFKPARTAPFVWEMLFRTEMVGIYSPHFSLEIHPDLGRFARLPLVLPSRDCSSRLLLDAELHRLGVVPNIVMEIDDSGSLTSMVRHGTAVSIIPRTMVRASAQIKLTPIQHPKIFAEVGLFGKRNPSKAASAFAELIRKEIETRRAVAPDTCAAEATTDAPE